VTPGGYAWWYIDALSDDGRHGITIIAFIGSVFSPYYAWAGRRDPLNHCALNVALYGKGGHRWAMTERRKSAVARSEGAFVLGPSALRWDGGRLRVEIDEPTVPMPGRIRGVVTLEPSALTGRVFDLDDNKRHQWAPLSPVSRVEVALEKPSLRWSGSAYLDANAGAESLEAGFRYWDWSRASIGADTAVLYDVTMRGGARRSLALVFDAAGGVREIAPPPPVRLPRSGWMVPRGTQSEDGAARVVKTLEDSPFYTRSLVAAKLLGQPVTAMHESLNLDRFRSPIVRLMLPFRMPRQFW
jgi:carotenoid 1,2-hydratase